MATAAIHARKGFLGFAATSSGTAGEIGEVTNATFTLTHRPIDATSFDSSGYDELIDGTRGATVTFGALYARTETEQAALRKSLSSTGITSKHYTFRPSTAQSQLWRFQGYVTSLGVVFGGTDAVVVHDVTIQATRTVTFTS